MDVQAVTLLIAVVGLSISLISLTWQIALHYLTGHRVKVQLLMGAIGSGGIVVGPIASAQMDLLAQQGYRQAVFAVRGRNRGRLPVDVTGFAVATGSGVAVYPPVFAANPSLPARLEAGSSVTFYVPMDQVQAALYAGEVIKKSGGRIWGTLDLATGKTARSKTHRVPVPES